jgi:hypothetical protein
MIKVKASKRFKQSKTKPLSGLIEMRVSMIAPVTGVGKLTAEKLTTVRKPTMLMSIKALPTASMTNTNGSMTRLLEASQVYDKWLGGNVT